MFEKKEMNNSAKRKRQLPPVVHTPILPVRHTSVPVTQSLRSADHRHSESDQSSRTNSEKENCGPIQSVRIKHETGEENRVKTPKSWEHECKRLRKKIKKLEERVAALEDKSEERVTMLDIIEPSVSNEDEQILQCVSHLNKLDVQKVLVLLANKIFTEEEMIFSSRTGKKTIKCTNGPPRPPINARKLQTLERVVRLKTAITRELFIRKFENLQKSLRHKCKKNWNLD